MFLLIISFVLILYRLLAIICLFVSILCLVFFLKFISWEYTLSVPYIWFYAECSILCTYFVDSVLSSLYSVLIRLGSMLSVRYSILNHYDTMLSVPYSILTHFDSVPSLPYSILVYIFQYLFRSYCLLPSILFMLVPLSYYCSSSVLIAYFNLLLPPYGMLFTSIYILFVFPFYIYLFR